MPVYRLPPEPIFPPPGLADPSGLLAVGGDLSPERLLAAYAQGIFPWYSEGQPILWHSPDPRFVLPLESFRVSRSLRKSRRRATVTFDRSFSEVVRACATVPRADQDGTWITEEMIEAYIVLHRLGLAHSVETWTDDTLCGGIYGVSLGSAFFGESMFHLRPDASKIALWALVERLRAWSFDLLDCQVYTPHLASLGAEDWSRDRFLTVLAQTQQRATRSGSWRE